MAKAPAKKIDADTKPIDETKENNVVDITKPVTEPVEETQEEQTDESVEGAPEAPAAASPAAQGAFAFTMEFGIEPPTRNQHGRSKYDWASFPKPADAGDSKTWPSALIPGVGSKTISQSIKKYRDGLHKAGEPDRTFTCATIKEPKAVRVYRTS